MSQKGWKSVKQQNLFVKQTQKIKTKTLYTMQINKIKIEIKLQPKQKKVFINNSKKSATVKDEYWGESDKQ